MATLSIKDVPDAWAEALRHRAARHHRSLQGELMAILEQALGAAPGHDAAAGSQRAQGRIVGYDRQGYPIVQHGWKPAAQVIAEMRARRPEPVTGQPLGVDIIRQDRDGR